MSVISRSITGTAHADSIWEDVVAYGSSSAEQIIPNGETWEVVQFIAAAAFMDDTEARLVWDYGGAGETILALTHGDLNMSLAKTLVGDGVKKLAIVLINDTIASRALGGSYEAITA